jgi:flagellar basal body-associated protein FliL
MDKKLIEYNESLHQGKTKKQNDDSVKIAIVCFIALFLIAVALLVFNALKNGL